MILFANYLLSFSILKISILRESFLSDFLGWLYSITAVVDDLISPRSYPGKTILLSFCGEEFGMTAYDSFLVRVVKAVGLLVLVLSYIDEDV